jgi:hypothetical protein
VPNSDKDGSWECCELGPGDTVLLDGKLAIVGLISADDVAEGLIPISKGNGTVVCVPSSRVVRAPRTNIKATSH